MTIDASADSGTKATCLLNQSCMQIAWFVTMDCLQVDQDGVVEVMQGWS
jgi:hypothetical protein